MTDRIQQKDFDVSVEENNPVTLPLIFRLSVCGALFLLMVSQGVLAQTTPSPGSDRPATKITVTHLGGCRSCPKFALTVFDDGRVEFDGRDKVKTMGRAEGIVEIEQASALAKTLESFGFWNLSDEYINKMSPDAEVFEIVFEKDKRMKSLRFNVISGEPGIHLYRFVKTFDATANVRQWVCPTPEMNSIICHEGNWVLPAF
jgi:hypothetical protein